MRVEFAGTQSVAAPIKTVWDRLLDAEFVASCAPGVQKVEPVDDTHYKVTAMLGVGTIQLKFAINLELLDLVPPSSARMLVRGAAPGSALSAESKVALVSDGPSATKLDWSVGADIRGTVASTGARLLQGTAKKLTQKFWTTFAKRAPRKG
jgi:carbon monoxide dehydrogenase subunit G